MSRELDCLYEKQRRFNEDIYDKSQYGLGEVIFQTCFSRFCSKNCFEIAPILSSISTQFFSVFVSRQKLSKRKKSLMNWRIISKRDILIKTQKFRKWMRKKPKYKLGGLFLIIKNVASFTFSSKSSEHGYFAFKTTWRCHFCARLK